MIPTDKEIIGLYSKNKNQGLKAIFDKYYTPLCVYAKQITGDLQIAEDIVQSLFIKCWQENWLFTVQTSLKAYLYTSVRNASLNNIKRKNYYEDKEIEDCVDLHNVDVPDADKQQDTEMIKKMEQAILQLPEKCRKVFLMVIVENHSYKDTALKLDVSVNTVKTQLSRALKKLRKKLESSYG